MLFVFCSYEISFAQTHGISASVKATHITTDSQKWVNASSFLFGYIYNINSNSYLSTSIGFTHFFRGDTPTNSTSSLLTTALWRRSYTYHSIESNYHTKLVNIKKFELFVYIGLTARIAHEVEHFQGFIFNTDSIESTSEVFTNTVYTNRLDGGFSFGISFGYRLSQYFRPLFVIDINDFGDTGNSYVNFGFSTNIMFKE